MYDSCQIPIKFSIPLTNKYVQRCWEFKLQLFLSFSSRALGFTSILQSFVTQRDC